MTIICAARNGQVAAIGGDSGGFYGDTVMLSVEAKVWKVGTTLLGACGNFRVIEVAKKSNLADPYRLRDLMAETPHLPEEWGIVVVTPKAIYELSEAMDVFCVKEPYYAVGTGNAVALGALYATLQGSLSIEQRVRKAVGATKAHSITNRPPYRYLTV